jgi:methyl-accepting chemotaxis protein
MTLTISRRLGLLVALGALVSLAITAIQLFSLNDSLLQERRAGVKMQVEQAVSVVKGLADAAAAGRITTEVAQQRAAEALRSMRFGEGEYFFVYGFDGLTKVHGLKPEFEGKQRIDTKDPSGKRYIAEMIDRAKTVGGAYVTYSAPRQGNDIAVPKISWVAGFAPWQWMIGTGVYLDDIDDIFWDRTMRASAIGAFLLAILMGSAWYLARGLVLPIRGLTDTMRRLTAGEIDTKVDGQEQQDEVGAMARAVQVFKDNAVALRDADADKERLASEAEATRREHDASNAAQVEAQQFVVQELAARLSRLAEGDLTARLVGFSGEYEALETDFNAAVERLQGAMQAISAKTVGMRGGTGEISQAADDLSRRTEQQAASLEETAAALDEITATVKKTAEGATHARQVVSTAKSGAEHSGTVVRDAVAAMSEIEKSSGQISQIIGVIDEIAFQTNLLALNAGVEAARAGEAGRGFAVVASEVRALAQRSAEAAKEIKGLIQASTTHVSSGVELVGETGKALDRIATQVTEINAIVAEIAASAAEQSTGLAEVNTAVNQMDQMTQQNAAMVEQTTAASHSLASEAGELATLVGRFKLGGTPAASAAPAPRSAPTRPALKIMGGRGASAQRKPQPVAQDESWEEF